MAFGKRRNQSAFFIEIALRIVGCKYRTLEHANICISDNGFLTIETLKGILLELEPNLPDEDLAQIIEEVDEDGSGTIDFDGKKLQ